MKSIFRDYHKHHVYGSLLVADNAKVQIKNTASTCKNVHWTLCRSSSIAILQQKNESSRSCFIILWNM